MEELKSMKKALINCVQSQINGNLKEVDAEELGEAVDMIKDLEEAIYYATITKAMEDGDKEKKEHKGQHEGLGNPYQHAQNTMYYPMYIDRPNPYEHRDKYIPPMYYDGNGRSNSMNGNMNGDSRTTSPSNGTTRNYQDRMMPYYEYPMEMLRDEREGRSPISRKNYMESKEHSQDNSVHMKELEKYLQELSQDVTEMVQKATPEEKQMLQQKISLLATKIK